MGLYNPRNVTQHKNVLYYISSPVEAYKNVYFSDAPGTLVTGIAGPLISPATNHYSAKNVKNITLHIEVSSFTIVLCKHLKKKHLNAKIEMVLFCLWCTF